MIKMYHGLFISLETDVCFDFEDIINKTAKENLCIGFGMGTGFQFRWLNT